jgi:hypothetical protein
MEYEVVQLHFYPKNSEFLSFQFINKQTALPIRLRIDSLSLSLIFGFCFDASLIQYLTLLAIASYKV